MERNYSCRCSDLIRNCVTPQKEAVDASAQVYGCIAHTVWGFQGHFFNGKITLEHKDMCAPGQLFFLTGSLPWGVNITESIFMPQLGGELPLK